MPGMKDLRRMTDEDLAQYMTGWKETTQNYIMCEIEFKRRLQAGNEVRGWIALGLSVLAILISIVALISNKINCLNC